MKTLTTEKFIEKARSVHGDKYDYSKVEYKNNKTKVCIICPKHGEFYQRPDEHLIGRGCFKCCDQYHYDTEIFIKKANEIHNNYFSYEKTIYTNARSKVIVTCPIHGDFEVKASNHLLGYNCSKCEKEGIKHLTTKKKQTKHTTKKLSNENIITYINDKYGDLYDTSLINYINNQTPIEIICNNIDYNNCKHGKFSITPNKLLSGQGCPKCGNNKPLTIEEFINKSNFIHQNKYNYDKSVYISTHKPLTITCPKHGDFEQTPANHLKGQGCPKCGNLISLNEDEIYNYICDLIGSENVIRRDRSVLNGKEIDIYIPQHHLGIEYHGCLWHSTKYKDDKNYHLNKYIGCKEKGVQLLQYFEDEYIHSKKIILSRIRTLLNCNNQPVIGGRQTIIKIISKSDCESFINENHIQGFAAASVYIGAFYKDKLIGVMSFKKEKNDCWDLNRCVTDINYRCPGVVSKMFNFFIKNYNFTTIKSFLDLRYGNIDNNIYIKLGFQMEQILKPDYHYISNTNINRQHKFSCRKQTLSKKYGLPLTMTEKEMTEAIGLYRIYDVGKVKYVFRKKTSKNI